MMTKQRVLIAAAQALLVLAAVYFEPTQRVRGRLWGEAFFEDRPTSWWRAELLCWEIIAGPRHGVRPQFHRPPSPFEQARRDWFPEPPPVRDLVPGDFLPGIAERRFGPSLMQGKDDALPVLHALKDDPSPHVRELVRIGLARHKERQQSVE